MNFFSKINLNKKKTIIYLIFFLLCIIISIYFIQDYNQSSQKQETQRQGKENWEKTLSENIRSKIPEKGEIIYMNFYVNDKKNKKNYPFLKEDKFRKSLFFILQREKITSNLSKLKPCSTLFTKSCFEDSTKYFPEPFLPSKPESYVDLELQNYGFNKEKSLKYLKEAYNNLSDEEKKQTYSFRLQIEKELKDLLKPESTFNFMKKSIMQQINDLFQEFCLSENLNPKQLQIIDSLTDNPTNFDIRIQKFPSKEEYKEMFPSASTAEDYFFVLMKDGYSFLDNSPISINLSHIKTYLENKQTSGAKIENNFFGSKKDIIMLEENQKYNTKENKFLLVNYKKISEEGILTDNINNFWDFCSENIFILFPSFGTDQSFGEESEEIKKLKQKTFEEIFEKTLFLLNQQMLNIPLFVYV
jgi:hypothetical protein